MKSFEQLLEEQMKDPDFRGYWQRTVLARRLGVSQAVVGRLELGEHEPKIATLSKLARTLGLRFNIEIHPEHPEGEHPDDRVVIERVVADGVELVVSG